MATASDKVVFRVEPSGSLLLVTGNLPAGVCARLRARYFPACEKEGRAEGWRFAPDAPKQLAEGGYEVEVV